MFEGLTAWHERNPLLDAFCEGLDSPAPQSEVTLEGFASESDVPSEDRRSASVADQETEALRWY